MVGNGITNYTTDVWPAYIPTTYNFNLIPKWLHDEYISNGCMFTFRGAGGYRNSFYCIELFAKIEELTAGLDWYDLYRYTYPDGLGLL